MQINEDTPGQMASYLWKGFYESKYSMPVQFRLTSDGNSALFVNNILAIDNLGEAGEGTVQNLESNVFILEKGEKRPIVLYYSNNENPGNVKLEWKYDAYSGTECGEIWHADFSYEFFFHNPSES